MNYKKADDERIKKNRQAVDKGREKVTKQTNDLENRTYSGKALNALSKGEYSTLKGSTYNRVPELQPNNTRPSTRYQNQNVTTTRPRQSTRDTRYDKDFDEFHTYRVGDKIGVMDYDKATDRDVEHWRNLKKDIMAKNKWSESEFDKRWDDYYNERAQKESDQEVSDAIKFAKKHPNLATGLQYAYTIPSAIEGGASAIRGALSFLPFISDKTKEKYAPTSADDRAFTNTRAQEGMKQAIKETKKMSKPGEWAYDIATGIPEMASPWIQAGKAAAQGEMNAHERGIDKDKAARTGLAQGAIAYGTGKLGLEKAIGSDTLKQAAMSEGGEEILENVLNLAADKLINKDKSQINALHDYYTSQGMSDSQASWQTFKDLGTETALSGVIGGLAGGGLHLVGNLPSLRGIGKGKVNTDVSVDTKVPELTGDPTVDNAIMQTVDAEAEIQRLSEQIPKVPEVASESAPTLTPEGQANIPNNVESFNGYKVGNKVTYSTDDFDGKSSTESTIKEVYPDHMIVDVPGLSDHVWIDNDTMDMVKSSKSSNPTTKIDQIKEGIKAKNFRPVTFVNNEGHTYIISKSTRPGEKWQLSHIDDTGRPKGHSAFSNDNDLLATLDKVNTDYIANVGGDTILNQSRTTIGDMLNNPDDYSLDDFKRAVRAYDTNADVDGVEKEDIIAFFNNEAEGNPDVLTSNIPINRLVNNNTSETNTNINESAPKNPSITSKPVDSKPIKEQLSPEDRASIFGGTRKGKRTQGLTDAVGYAKKFAGETDEAKQLAKECKDLLESYVESGDIEEYDALLHKIEDLDNLARNTKAEYKTKKGDVFTYDKYFTDFDEKGNEVPSSLLERFVYNRSLNNSVKKLQNARVSQDVNVDGQLSPEEVSKLQDVVDGKYDIPENGNEVPNVKPSEPTPPGNNPPNNNVPEVGEKVRSFSKRGSMDDTLPDEVRNVLKSDYYKVARNADTEAKANSLFNPDNLTDTRSNLEQLLEKKDPASALLSYKLAGAYVDAKQYDAATDVLRQVSEKLTEAGQFTQAAKLAMVKNDPMAALRMYQRDLDSINQWGKEKYGKKWEKLKLTDADKEAFRGIKEGDAEALSDLVDDLNSRFGKEIPSTWWDKVVSATKTSMLLNPRTQVRNITANMALLPIRSATDRVSALGQNIVHLIDPDVKVTQSLTGGSKEQKDIAGKIFDNMKSEILGENKMKDSTKSDILSHRQTFNDDFFAKWVNNHTNGGVEKLNKMLGSDANKSTMETLQNFTYWLMGDFGDAPFVKKNFVNRLASYMKAQGINNIDDVPDDAIALATQEALKATFKDDNAFTKALQGAKQKTGKFGEVALPFTKTPANLAVRAYDYSPLGIISTIKKAKSGAEIGEVIDDLSKNLTGTAMILLGMKLRDKGILSGNYSDDDNEAAAQKRQGMLENAFHIGNKYFTYDWAQPAATPLVLGSVIQDAINASDEQNKEAKDIVNASWRGGIKVANTIINSSPLQSLSDMLGSSSYSDDDGPAENIAKEIIEFPQRFIPSVLGATARVSDPYYRETYTNDGGLTGILKSQVDSAKAKIPELSKTLPISYDTWGQARRRSNTTGEAALAQYVNPGQFGIDTSIPIDKDIQAIYDATGNNAVFPKYAPRSVDLGNDGTIKLDNRQHSEYQKELGQLSRNFAEGLLGNSEFKNLSDDQKAEMLGNAYNFANAKTKEKLFDHVTDVGKHLNEAYESGGVDGAVKYWINKSKADELGLTYDTYIKKESEQPGSAAQYAQDKQQLDAINEKYGTEISMSTYEKYGAQGVDQRAQNTNEALKYGFVDKDGGANIDSYEKAVSIVGNNDASLRAYSNYKKQGFEKNNQRVPYLLDNNSFSAEQKGMIIAGTNPDKLKGTAKGVYNIGGYEGVWDYYMLKNMFDKDDSGGLNKKEKSELYAFMNSDSPYVTSIPDDVYYYLGSIKRW